MSADSREQDAKSLRIMVFAPEMKRIVAPKTITSRSYELSFHRFDSPERYDGFDGVIVFQGVFEEINVSRTLTGEEHVKHRYAKNELDRRIKELKLLFDKGGFACFVLCEPFLDENHEDLSQTDLVKYFLALPDLYRRNFPSRVPQVRTVLSEFKAFLDVWGAANSWFDIPKRYPNKPIARVGDRVVGMILGRKLVCVPAQLPDTTDGRRTPRAEEYFESLTAAVVAVIKKQAVEIPEWADAFKFEKETIGLKRKEELTQELGRVEAELDALRSLKWILIYDGDDLVDAVRNVFETGFGFRVETIDELKEDMKLLDTTGNPFLLAEVKGTNAGVKREHVNQADSHRERAGLPVSFPSILVMNTAIKKARSLDEKDEQVASEQVEHATRHNILILRTLDLLKLLALYARGAVTREEVQRLLTTGGGWLKVTDERAELMES